VVFYTWFHPREPFLWLLECLPLVVVGVAVAMRDRPRLAWAGMVLFSALLLAHNYFAFYVPFR